MRYKIKSNNTIVNLTQKNFKASGGEADIYVNGNTVYKICHPGKMIPLRKIQELKTLANDLIIVPQEILVDEHNVEVGYTMKYIPSSIVLCQLFTKAFKERNKIEPKTVLALIRQMQATLNFIHSCNILVVDCNEFNFLISSSFDEAYFIDVNSYQTPSFPATVIMDSIRDRHATRFSKLSDWFSFGIISFNTFIGIHPFKGKHTKYKTLDERMQYNVSVLNPEVSYPKGACYDFSIIPQVYLKWYEALFEKGIRIPPPENLIEQINVVLSTKTVVSDDIFIINKIQNRAEDVIHYSFKDYSVRLENTTNIVEVSNIKTHVNLPAQEFMLYQNRLYLKCKDRIDEVLFNDKLKGLIYTSKVSDCLEYATKFWDGCALENIFGDWFVIIFPKTGQALQIKLKELFKYKIIDAKFENGVLKVIGVKNGNYNKFTYTLDSSGNFNIPICINDSPNGLNFTVLDNGLCVEIVNDEEMILTRGTQEKIIKSQQISMNWRLSHEGNQVIFTENGQAYSLGMK